MSMQNSLCHVIARGTVTVGRNVTLVLPRIYARLDVMIRVTLQ